MLLDASIASCSWCTICTSATFGWLERVELWMNVVCGFVAFTECVELH